MISPRAFQKMNLQKALRWRYATKAINGETVPPEKVQKILDAI